MENHSSAIELLKARVKEFRASSETLSEQADALERAAKDAVNMLRVSASSEERMAAGFEQSMLALMEKQP